MSRSRVRLLLLLWMSSIQCVAQSRYSEFAATVDQVSSPEAHGLISVRGRKHLMPGNACSEYPAVGALVRKQSGEAHCTATLIEPRIALTAAHCLAQIQPSSLELRFGDNIDSSKERYDVLDGVSPASYTMGYDTDDIALVLLDKPVDGIAPLSYRLEGMPAADDSVLRVVGFGYSASNGVSGIGVKRCTDIKLTDVRARVLLYSLPQYGVCHGDSGGPAIQPGEPARVAGITSWGSANCEGVGASVNVGKYAPWIRDQVATFTARTKEKGAWTVDGHIRIDYPCAPENAQLCEHGSYCSTHRDEAIYYCKKVCSQDSECPYERCYPAESAIAGKASVKICASGDAIYWPEKGAPVPAPTPPRERTLDVLLASGDLRGEDGNLRSKYLASGWEIIEIFDLRVGDRVGVRLRQDENIHNCALLDVFVDGNRIRGTVAAREIPSANSTLNDWTDQGWRVVSHTQFGQPPIGDRMLYAVCK